MPNPREMRGKSDAFDFAPAAEHRSRLSSCHDELGSRHKSRTEERSTHSSAGREMRGVSDVFDFDTTSDHRRRLTSCHDELEEVRERGSSAGGRSIRHLSSIFLDFGDLGDDDDDAPKESEMGTRVRGLSVGLMPGSTVMVKSTQVPATVLKKAMFKGSLRYVIKLSSTGEEEEILASEVDIAEPPVGWIVSAPPVDGKPAVRGLVVGASWFKDVRRVEIDLDDAVVWRDLKVVVFEEPAENTRVAVRVDEETGTVLPGVVEGVKRFRGAVEVQVRFDERYLRKDDPVDGWYKTQELLAPNEFG
jgi:hypothetical protein